MKISSLLIGISTVQAFAPQYHGRMSQPQYLSSNPPRQDDFIMPDAKTLISDVPAAQRGMGVGIDLGTTNSAIFILNNQGDPILIKVDGKTTIPSVVSIRKEEDDDIEITVGVEFSNNDAKKSDVFFYRHVKRVIGMGTTTAAGSSEVVPHLLIRTASQRRSGKSLNTKSKQEGLGGLGLQKMLKEAKENPIRLSLPEGVEANAFEDNVTEDNQGTISPEQISSQILKKLFTAAEIETGEKITRAVIGVPA